MEERTGLKKDNLNVEFLMPDPSLITSLKQNESGSQQQMQKYLKQTTVGRKLEEQRIDKYVIKRREISREKYNDQSSNFIKNNSISEKNIIFISEYTPSIICQIKVDKILSLANDKTVDSISLYTQGKQEKCSSDSMKVTTQLNKVYSETGLTGKNVKIGMFDVGAPEPNAEINVIPVGNVTLDGHATNSARAIMGSINGVAPNITLYATNANYANIEQMLSLGIKLMNVSFGWREYNIAYSDIDRWFDHICVQHNVLLICSAGNNLIQNGVIPNEPILTPSMAYNTLSVGAYDDKESGSDYSDDQLFYYSRYDNKNGCSKPDIIAPGNVLGGGTSTSAPIVTGIAALLLELKPSLGFQPQVLKAILLASCQRKVQSPKNVAAETMEQGLTKRQGAGAIDAWNAVCIVAQGNYGYGEVKDMAEKRNFVQPSYGAGHMNVSIAWLRENTISSNNHANGSVTAGTQHNLNLSVYRNGTLVGSSSNANSSTEMAYFPLSSSESRYQIKVSNYNHASTETVRYGYAWSTDNMTFRENLTGTVYPEGIYYIRSKANANGAYLTVDEETGQVSQEAFTGTANQQWVSRKTGNDPFTIRTNSSMYPGYLSISGQTSAWIKQNEVQSLALGGNSYDNTYGIQLYGLSSSMSRSLTALDITAQSAEAVWQNMGFPERYQWYFEPVGYKRGDVNRDGKISNADYLLLQRCVSGLASFDAAQEFLGDINNDGQITAADVKLLQNLITSD